MIIPELDDIRILRPSRYVRELMSIIRRKEYVRIVDKNGREFVHCPIEHLHNLELPDTIS